MRRTVIVLLITLFATVAGAQRLTQTFTNVSMADALTAIAQLSTDYRVQFIYDELEDFTVTTTIEDKEVPSAIRQVIGFYPIVMTVDGQDIFVECVRKERSKVSGTLVDEHSDPIPLANVSLLSPTDSMFITGGVSNEAGRFVIPCGVDEVLVRITRNGYRPLLLSARKGDMGSIVLEAEGISLEELEVDASYLLREPDHLLALPTKEQRKHAITGYDLLGNLMIPGLKVDRTNGVVTTPAGTATLYIDGRKATFREIQSLRPKDIYGVEYYDIPTGKYAMDVASVNILMKEQGSGGYTQVDAKQGVGFLNGDYNLISKYAIGTKSINLWAGGSLEDPKTSFSEAETFAFPSSIERNTEYSHAGNRSEKEYVQASFSDKGEKMTWTLRAGVEWNKERQTVRDGTIDYGTSSLGSYGMETHTKDRSLVPSLMFYGKNELSKTLTLEYSLDGQYSRNHHDRLYIEGDSVYPNDVKEDYYFALFNTNLSKTLAHDNSLSFGLYEVYQLSQSDYMGQTDSNEHLYSSETLFFCDYSQRVGRFFYTFHPGVSFLTYRLRGMDAINHLSPRLNVKGTYTFGKGQQIQLHYDLGNTFPEINTVNNAEQQLDPIIMLRGNPKMDNSIVMGYRLGYSLSLGKVALQAGIEDFYLNHAIVRDYFIEGDILVSTFRDDAVLHYPWADISITYKPTNSLNMNVSGEWHHPIVRGTAPHDQLSSYMLTAEVNYYVGDFSFSASLNTPERLLDYSEVRRLKTPWCYRLSAMWNHGSWAVEVKANNLFLTKNRMVYDLHTSAYSYHSETRDRSDNQYATLKVVYNIEYGMKTSKSSEYKHVQSGSAILR